jgi:DNA-3-methyladenine glycosylase
LNIVTGREGEAEAVLIRALEPVNFDLDCSGPGKLTKSLGINKESHKGRIGKEIKIIEGEGDFEIMESKRVGVREDLDKNLRFFIKNNKHVSR